MTPFFVPGEVSWQSCSELVEVGASVRIGRCLGLTESSDAPGASRVPVLPAGGSPVTAPLAPAKPGHNNNKLFSPSEIV